MISYTIYNRQLSANELYKYKEIELQNSVEVVRRSRGHTKATAIILIHGARCSTHILRASIGMAWITVVGLFMIAAVMLSRNILLR